MLDDLTSFIAATTGLAVSSVESARPPRGGVLHGFACPPDARTDAWRRLRSEFSRTGLWPFVSHQRPTDWDWDETRSGAQHVAEPAGHRPVLERLLAEQSGQLRLGVPGAGPPADGLDALVESLTRAIGDGAAPARGLDPDEVFARPPGWICLAPVADPSGLPELLDAPDTVNWTSDAPDATLGYADHSAVLREWNVRYGAVPYQIGSRTLVLAVKHPPVSRRETARVALEQFAYCPDLEQVLGGPVAIAQRQAGADRWFFHWD
ncbi:DUF4253 domain-containing protein [Streptomyces sp. NBC_00236]|uniref:DUF4253 domain-containing protein n=1 Tax=Streptomyces sp. NBC_00236 TaxID=2903639 RepID=UPI002E2CB422|nr:DUF4253 domain-containing protein [Streptomyces sp. NBC_00236]